ncbi:MAG: hypothetical protein AB1521_13440 [Bacteroidota bacterium]
MITKQTDTNPEIEKVLITLLKKSTVSERLSQMFSLSSVVMGLSRRAIVRANPGCSEDELDLLFVKYNYGEELAKRFESFLNKRNETN